MLRKALAPLAAVLTVLSLAGCANGIGRLEPEGLGRLRG